MQLPYRVRLWGHGVFGSIPVRIPSGPNRGRRWSLASLGRGYGSGRFARDRLGALEAVAREGDCFWDVGAHKGYVTLAASGMVGESGEVVAFEPSATNLSFLRRHLAWNRVANATVVPVALSDQSGTAAFGGTGSSIAFRLGTGPERIRVASGMELATELGLRRPTVMKVDVEGEEVAVLRGLESFLEGELVLLISTHSRQLYDECTSLLAGRGFEIYDSWEIKRCKRLGVPWTSDHDVLAVGPARDIVPDAIHALPLISGRAP